MRANDRLLTIGEAAAYLGCSVDTVRRLEGSGELEGTRTEGGHRRFSPTALAEFLEGRPKPRSGMAPESPAGNGGRVNAAGGHTSPIVLDVHLPAPPSAREEKPPCPPTRPPEEPRSAPVVRSGQDQEELAAKRIELLKTFGLSLIPFTTGPLLRAEIVANLEEAVTPQRLPQWLPEYQAREIVRVRVQEALERSEGERREELKIANRLEKLRRTGAEYAARQTLEWDFLLRNQTAVEVKEVLEREVDDGWREGEVRLLVDEILEEWWDEE